MISQMTINKDFCMKNNIAVQLLFIVSLQFAPYATQAGNLDDLKEEASNTLETTKQKMVEIAEDTAEIVRKAIDDVSDQVEIKALELLNELDRKKESTVDETDATLKEV